MDGDIQIALQGRMEIHLEEEVVQITHDKDHSIVSEMAGLGPAPCSRHVGWRLGKAGVQQT